MFVAFNVLIAYKVRRLLGLVALLVRHVQQLENTLLGWQQQIWIEISPASMGMALVGMGESLFYDYIILW